MTDVIVAPRGGRLYKNVAETLRHEIERGRFSQSQLLPGERTLCELLEVSRSTLRKAIVELVSEGVLFHRHGAGTFIHRSTPRVDQPMSRLTSFTDDMELRGFVASSQLLERGIFLPTPEEAMMLGVGPNERVFRLRRLKLASGTPMAIEHAVVAVALCARLGSARRFALRRPRPTRISPLARPAASARHPPQRR